MTGPALPTRLALPFLEERVVAFIDILGFRDLLRRIEGREPELAENVHHCLTGAHAKEEGIYGGLNRQVEMTSFSDCTVISASPAGAVEVLAKSAYLCRDFIVNGILTRSAVVVGKAYHRERILFGPAVVAAYEAERNVAKYPRIYVADEIADDARARRASRGVPITLATRSAAITTAAGTWTSFRLPLAAIPWENSSTSTEFGATWSGTSDGL